MVGQSSGQKGKKVKVKVTHVTTGRMTCGIHTFYWESDMEIIQFNWFNWYQTHGTGRSIRDCHMAPSHWPFMVKLHQNYRGRWGSNP
jgi:hypothetical protein